MRLIFKKGKLFYLEYNFRLFVFLIFKKYEILNACDLDTLLANHLASKIKRSKVVYDSHEYFTQVPELIGRPKAQAVWLKLEKWLFPKVEAVYTVNNSLAHIYSEKYDRKVSVIRNLPFRENNLASSKHKVTTSLGSDPEPTILIYQGALNLGRGIDLMIDAMEFLPEYQLWIVGKGDVEAELRTQVSASNFSQRIVFQGFMPMEGLSNLTAQSHMGLSLEEDLGGNYHYASPNKIYDYIQAGLPVLVSDLPEMRALVETYEVGEVLPKMERNPRALANRIQSMLESTKIYTDYATHSRAAASALCWEKEEGKLLEIYKAIL